MVKTYKLQNSKITHIIYGGVFALLFAVIALFYHSVNSVHADSVDFSVSIDPSLNITIPTNLVTLDLNPATNAFASQNLTVSVGTNNPTGYTLTMNSSSTSLTRTEMVDSSYPVIATLDAAVAENNFTANRWGYRFNDSANTNYQPFTTNLPYNSSTEAVDNDSRTISFAAKVDTNQAPGTYELGLDFTAVTNPLTHDCTKQYRLQNADGTWPTTYTQDTIEEVAAGSTCTYTKTVTDYKGTANGTNDSAGTVQGTMNDTGITLSLDLYRNTYALTVNRNTTYISTATATTEPVYTSGGSNYYRWGQTVNISVTPSTANNGKFTAWSVTSGSTGTFGSTTSASTTYTMPKGNSTIYANGELNVVTIATATYMQDVSSKSAGGCPSTLTTGQAYQLTDSRDGEVYYVARLADGNCWLLDNLRLDLTSVSLATLKGKTNATDTTLTYLKNGGGSSPNTDRAVANWTSSDSYTRPLIAVSGTGNNGNWTKNTTVVNSGSGSGKIGVYYNYCAASAGSYCYDSSSGSGDAQYDICPKGWRMPTGGSSGEYRALCNTLKNSLCFNGDTNSDAIKMLEVLSTPFSGYFLSGSASSQDSYGYFWSSTNSTKLYMYSFYGNSSTVYPLGGNDRVRGLSVRCILK